MNGIRRALPSALLAAAALACAFALERSLACPVQLPPQPLRTLYKHSKLVFVARVGATEVLKVEDGMAQVRVALHVTEKVKGEPAQPVHYYYDDYVGEAAVGGEGGAQPASLAERLHERLKQGERYLFFPEPREEGDGYVINDERYGLKELPGDDLKVYLERLKELAEIERREPEDKLAVVEWLVRCAEQPATRWEGAYELLESAEAISRGEAEARARGEAEPIQAPAGEQANAASAEAPAPDSAAEAPAEEITLDRFEFRYTEPDPSLAPLLDAAQKQRLADALFASDEPSEGDDVLMQVVKDFDDPRLPAFLLARLHRFEDDAPPAAELWLRTLAASLKNPRLAELAASYTQDATYYEYEEEGGEPEAEASNDEAAETEEAEEQPPDPEVAAAAEERAKLKRSALLKELLTRIDLFVATGQLKQ
jgi:hypothetical protein